MVRTTLGAEVDTTVTVSGSESVVFLDASQGSTVSANQGENVVVRPQPGFVFELLSLRARIPAVSGTAGSNHFVELRSESQSISSFFARSGGDKVIFYDTSYIRSATIEAQPPSTTAQTLAVRGLRADPSNGYEFRYQNGTSQDQSSSRDYQLWVRRIRVED